MRDAYLKWAARWRVRLGFVVIVPYLYFARPTPLSLAVGAAVAAVGIALRAAAAGTLRKGEALTTAGPYAYVRHPLYLGSAFLVVGFAIAGRRTWLGISLLAIFVTLYLPVLLREEAEMHARFPADFAAYAAAVPCLVPRMSSRRFRGGGERFSWRLYWRNREYNALAGYLAALLVLFLRMRYGP